MLLLHGTGASSHSWRDLLLPLSSRFTVVVPDLPGHGFSSAPAQRAGYTLPGMARSVTLLLDALGLDPSRLMGHSAGAAIGVRMALERGSGLRHLVAINGALLPLPGMPVPLFALAARVLGSTPLVAAFVARRATDGDAVQRLIAETGSRIGADGVALYQKLMRDPDHVRGALWMMGQWDLRLLERDLLRLETPLLLAVGGNDRTVPPTEAERIVRLQPRARIEQFADLGHLAHEERPEVFVALLERLN